MQKTLERLSTLNTFQFRGIRQYYMIFRREVDGKHQWQYEWLDVDCEPHGSGWFNKIEHVVGGLVKVEQECFKRMQECYPEAVKLYSDEQLMKLVLEKIANLENPDTRDWLLHKGE